MSIRSAICRWLTLCSLFLLTHAAHAASIAFHLELTGTRLTLTNTGSGTAFFPSALALQADGNWKPVSVTVGQQVPTQLPSGGRLELTWPDTRPLESLSPLERLRPTMIRFFDQSGVGFGHISFFTTPPAATAPISASYDGDTLQLSPPKGTDIRATWALWPQEEGIASISTALNRHVVQPPARRIDWQSNPGSTRIDTGKGRPSVVLLHETAQGFQVQRVPSGWEGRKQQTASWIASNRLFFGLALMFAAAAVVAVLRAARRRAVLQ